jgi:hypothetical protein
MARIRSVKPDFFTSETIAQLDMIDRLLFIGLWTHVDDNGVCRDVPALMKAAVFPLDECVTLMRVTGGLMRLSELGLVVRYKVDSKGYLAVSAWSEHQKVQHPGKDRYPGPDQAQEILIETSRDSHETLTPEQGAGSREQGGEQGAVAPAVVSHETLPGTDVAVAEAPARKRNLVFDALLEVCGIEDAAELGPNSSAYGKSVNGIRKMTVGLSDEEIVDEVRVRATRYLMQFADCRITHTALVKHWPSLTRASEELQSGKRRGQVADILDAGTQAIIAKYATS